MAQTVLHLSALKWGSEILLCHSMQEHFTLIFNPFQSEWRTLRVQRKFRVRIYKNSGTPVWEARRLLGRSSRRWCRTLFLSSFPSAGGDCRLLPMLVGGYESSGCFWTELWSIPAYASILETREHKRMIEGGGQWKRNKLITSCSNYTFDFPSVTANVYRDRKLGLIYSVDT